MAPRTLRECVSGRCGTRPVELHYRRGTGHHAADDHPHQSADAEINVPLNAAINATFSEAMDPATIVSPGTFTLAVSGAGGAAVPGNVTYNSASNIATFTPAANLAASTQYTATISNAAKDLAGNALAAGATAKPVDLYDWRFRRPTAA